MKAHYFLNKYSRAYFPTSVEGQHIQPNAFDSEWQHFSTPHLLVELELEDPQAVHRPSPSARVKVIWKSSQSGNNTSCQDTVLEDLDLLSFQGLPPPNSNSSSAPIKVIYRDYVVGFRYLYTSNGLSVSEHSKQYRRFQISFTDPSLPVGNSTHAMKPLLRSMPGPVISPNEMQLSSQNNLSTKPVHHSAKDYPAILTAAPAIAKSSLNSLPNAIGPMSKMALSASMNQSLNSSKTSSDSFTIPMQTQPSYQNSSEHLSRVAGQMSHDPISLNNNIEEPDETSMNRPNNPALFSNSQPHNSEPGSSSRPFSSQWSQSHYAGSQGTLTGFTDNPSNIRQPETSQTNNKTLNMTEISNYDFEKMIGDLLREPDFLLLLERLEATWRVKCLIPYMN